MKTLKTVLSVMLLMSVMTSASLFGDYRVNHCAPSGVMSDSSCLCHAEEQKDQCCHSEDTPEKKHSDRDHCDCCYSSNQTYDLILQVEHVSAPSNYAVGYQVENHFHKLNPESDLQLKCAPTHGPPIRIKPLLVFCVRQN